MGKTFNNTDIIWSLLLGMFAPLEPDFTRSFSNHPKLPRKLKKWVKKEMQKEGLNTKRISKVILCSEYFNRVRHFKIAWMSNYYKSIVDIEKVKKSYKERYQQLTNSEWFNVHYLDKSLGEIIKED